MLSKEIEIFYPKSQTEWRLWLEINHNLKQNVWLVFHNKTSTKPTISWSDAVDEALCYGWIDSKKIKIDSKTSHQYFSKRKPKSTWSKINKEKVLLLIKSGKMTKAGLDIIEIAKQNGSWTIIDEVEELIIPNDLKEEFKKCPKAKVFFHNSSKSFKKIILYWLVSAKTSETRKKRIDEIILSGEQNLKPKHLR
jgi:uncharacterized protein YdeI (YjbR/CyaY-like superfamily)